jgi:type VI secretion system protein ImpK
MTSARIERSSAGGRGAAYGLFVNLAAPLLELVLKLQTGAVAASTDVRPVVSDLLKQLETNGRQLRCNGEQIEAVKFALVAFIDETVLSPTRDFPLRKEWEQLPLQLEYFKEHLAGVKFFERLDEMLAQPEDEVADVVEVYYLCLLLGFKGKYNFYLLEEQLKSVIANVADYLRREGRLKANALSAHGMANDQPELPRDPGLPLWLKVGAPATLGILVVTYVLLLLLLRNDLNLVR